MTGPTARTLCAGFAPIAFVSTAQSAAAQQSSFDEPAQDLSTAIPEFVAQAGLQIVAPVDRLE